MIDMVGIVFSTLMMLITIVNAVRLDRIQPWFQVVAIKTPQQAKAGSGGRKPWQRDPNR